MKLFFLFFCFLSLSVAYAEESKLRFADELTSQTDYFRAMTVLKEFEFNNRGNEEGFKAQKKILLIHFKSNDFEMLDINTESLVKNYSKFLSVDASELKAESRFFLKNYQTAFDMIKDTNAPLEKKYFFKAFTKTSEVSLPVCTSELCGQIIELDDLSKNHPPKNPNLALALGIIPGVGQMYAGNVGSGVGSMLLSAFFSTATIIAFNNKEPAFGFASASVGTVFYLSSIYAGHQTALRRNEGFSQQQQKKLRSLPVSFKLLDLSFQ